MDTTASLFPGLARAEPHRTAGRCERGTRRLPAAACDSRATSPSGGAECCPAGGFPRDSAPCKAAMFAQVWRGRFSGQPNPPRSGELLWLVGPGRRCGVRDGSLPAQPPAVTGARQQRIGFGHPTSRADTSPAGARRGLMPSRIGSISIHDASIPSEREQRRTPSSA